MLENELERARYDLNARRDADSVLAKFAETGAPSLCGGRGDRLGGGSAEGRGDANGAEAVGKGGRREVVGVGLEEGKEAGYGWEVADCIWKDLVLDGLEDEGEVGWAGIYGLF